MMKIYYEDNHLIVIEKPANQPSQEDSSGDVDIVTELKQFLKEKYQKPGKVFVGLVQRLDRPVGGVMVFAKTSKAASRLSEQVRHQSMEKIYTAVVEGKPSLGIYTDWLRKDRQSNTSKVVAPDHPEGKKAVLEVLTRETQHHLSRVTLALKTGRSHQIRVQFAARQTPLWGDVRYNHQAQAGEQIALWATSLSFNHPITKERLTFKSQPPAIYPFTLW